MTDKNMSREQYQVTKIEMLTSEFVMRRLYKHKIYAKYILWIHTGQQTFAYGNTVNFYLPTIEWGRD